MALLKYVRYVKHKQTENKNVFKLPTNVSALSSGELKEANSRVSEVAQSKSLSSTCISRDHVNYNKYTEQRAMIGRYAAENGPTHVANHLKDQSLHAMHACMHCCHFVKLKSVKFLKIELEAFSSN